MELVLGIDTSCDDTSVAVTYKTKVISNVISSQIDMHKMWGGTVPGLAKREHEKRIDKIVEQAIRQAVKNIKQIGNQEKKLIELVEVYETIRTIGKKNVVDCLKRFDAVAVTYGPGLAIALGVGIDKAKELAVKFDKPLIGVNHMEGHLLSALAERNSKSQITNNKQLITHHSKLINSLPSLGVLVSGGHTQLVLVNGVGDYKIIGETLDDAIGEAFDKAARILKLGYPGGPVISEFAKKGRIEEFDFPVAMRNSNDLNVSYSGLKTAMLYKVRELTGQDRVQRKKKQESWSKENPEPEVPFFEDKINLDKQTICDLCASFQQAAIATLVNKVEKALKIYKVKFVLLGGGVVANVGFRKAVRKVSSVPVLFPYSKKLFQDNGAMIGVVAFLGVQAGSAKILRTENEVDSLDRDPNLRLNN